MRPLYVTPVMAPASLDPSPTPTSMTEFSDTLCSNPVTQWTLIPSFNQLCRSMLLRLICMFREKQRSDCFVGETVFLSRTQITLRPLSTSHKWTQSQLIEQLPSAGSAEMWRAKSQRTSSVALTQKTNCSLQAANRVRMTDEFHKEKFYPFFVNCFLVSPVVNSILQIRKLHPRTGHEGPGEGEEV